MLKWFTANLRVLLLVALTVATIGPLFAVWWASRELTWATTLPITSVFALWLGLLYQRNVPVRRWINGILAEYGAREMCMSLQVRYAVPDDIDYAVLEQVIRGYYADSADSPSFRVMEGHGQLSIDAPPGWRMRLELSTLADDELEDSESGHHDLLIVVPETFNNVRDTKRLVSRHILPLFDQLQRKLKIEVQAAELKIHYGKDANPYLSIYFQDTSRRHIRSLNCVLEGLNSVGKVTLTADSVMLGAPDLFTLRNLMDEHLVLFRSGK